jgi:hypothetical protein
MSFDEEWIQMFQKSLFWFLKRHFIPVFVIAFLK